MLGWHPSVVDYRPFPDLTAEKLEASLLADEAGLRRLGYDARWSFLYSADTAAKDVAELLRAEVFDVVLVGAGVRKVDEHFLVFEMFIKIIHKFAPQTRIAFNTGPTDSAAAIQRALVSQSPKQA